MAKYRITAILLAAGFVLALGVVRPPQARALTMETFSLNPNASSNFTDPDQKAYQQYKANEDALSGDSSGSGDDGPHNLTFGSPDSGFSFSVGRTDNPYNSLGSPRFFSPDPFRQR